MKVNLLQTFHIWLIVMFRHTDHQPLISRNTIKVLKELRKNRNLVILKPDKGNGVVVLDRLDYDNGILKIISDTSKFRPIKDDPTLLREGRLQRLLRKLKNSGHLDNDVYNNICPKVPSLPESMASRRCTRNVNLVPSVSSDCIFNWNI